MNYKPLNLFTKQTDELKKLIAEHPDYPIVVLCGMDVVPSDDFYFWYAPTLRFSVGEILDCEQAIDDKKVYSDRDDLEEDMRNLLADDESFADLTDEEFDKAVQEKLKEFEPYWKDVIQIIADI